jgi:regulatory protein
MRIQKIAQGKGTRVWVGLDDQASIPLHIDAVVGNKLAKGVELSLKQLSTIVAQSMEIELRQAVIGWVQRRPRSIAEAVQYLQKKLTKHPTTLYLSDPQSETLINKIIQNLTNRDYLNDQRFAQWWYETRTKTKQYGWKRISLELRQKGVATEIISTLENELDESRHSEQLKKALAKHLRQLAHRNYPKPKCKQLLINRLLRQGYSWQQIQPQIDECLNSQYND